MCLALLSCLVPCTHSSQTSSVSSQKPVLGFIMGFFKRSSLLLAGCGVWLADTTFDAAPDFAVSEVVDRDACEAWCATVFLCDAILYNGNSAACHLKVEQADNLSLIHI